MKVKYIILLTLCLVVFTGINLVPLEKIAYSSNDNNNLELRQKAVRTNRPQEEQSFNTFERIKKIKVEIDQLLARKHPTSDIPSATAFQDSEEIDQILSKISHPNKTLQVLERIRDSLRDHDSLNSDEIIELSASIDDACLVAPIVSSEHLTSIMSTSYQNYEAVPKVKKRKRKVSDSSKWIMIGSFDDEQSIRRTVLPKSAQEQSSAAERKPTLTTSQPIPKSYQLHQNYPNPFNPSTTIAFDIPEEIGEICSVELKIYNVRGKLIRDIIDEEKKPGHYSITWDGRNDKGESVGSGVYLYCLKIGEFSLVRKMLLTE